MLIEENHKTIIEQPDFSFEKDCSIKSYLASIKQTVKYYKMALKKHPNKGVLNENELTQLFVTQLNTFLSDGNFPFLAQAQYSDTYLKTKGIPDFFLHKKELGADFPALFVVEAKILTIKFPEKRKKEYVIGENKNGGIERFKIEKHGKGLNNCGLLGFIAQNTSEYWLETINKWILELSETDKNWQKSEVLTALENNNDYTYLTSTSQRVSFGNVKLYHIWVF